MPPFPLEEKAAAMKLKLDQSGAYCTREKWNWGERSHTYPTIKRDTTVPVGPMAKTIVRIRSYMYMQKCD